MVFLHGYGQSRMCWMTTPDGREGWAEMFLRDGHSVYLVDEPRRGEAGQTSVSGTISTKTLDQRWYTQFRIGRWEDGKSVPNEGSQFPNDDNSVDQFFRQMTPDTGMTSDMGGDFDNDVVAQALASTVDEVYESSGKDSILVTHSQGGGPGWTAAKYTDHIAAIVAIEPGGAPSSDSEDYQTVLEKKIPITMYFGDYIDYGDTAIQATGMWQGMRQACYDFADAYTKAHTPKIKVMRPQASYLIWLDCRELGLSHEALNAFFVDKAGLALNDGEMFGKEGAGFMRMNVGCPRVTLEKALQQLKAAYEAL